ncbi:MAG: cation-transporting P-type ATPase, partial [Candidatus Aenigmatarchaeota archaeon]
MEFLWNELSTKQVLEKLNSDEKGISEEESLIRLQKYGPNEIREEKKISKTEIFINQFRSTLV